MWYLFEPRSKDYGYEYDEPEGQAAPSPIKLSDILLFPIKLVFVILGLLIFELFFLAAPFIHLLYEIFLRIKSEARGVRPRLLIFLGILLAIILALVLLNLPTSTPAPLPLPTPTGDRRTFDILVDDFSLQPYQGETVYFYNRLEGDRGAMNDSVLELKNGRMTTTIASGQSWGGGWMSLNHPIREGLSINFSAILPPQISSTYQSQVTGIKVLIAGGTPSRTFRLELKNGEATLWKQEVTLTGQQQEANFGLPPLGNINQLVWVLDHAAAGNSVVLDKISLTATTYLTGVAWDAFVWSYGMLLNNWNADTGLARDKAKDASGEFDAIQATGSLAAATAAAVKLGVVSREDAVQIVNKIGDTLLVKLPRFHGLWPHWVKTSAGGEFTIVENTEWSSVDTVIAAIGLLEAQTSLGLDTTGTQKMLQGIDWGELVTSSGISHGYTYAGERIPYAWDTFGGESWLVELAYAGAVGQVAPLAYASPPTANGSGFIDELAWLFAPPPSLDYWGTDWVAYRQKAAEVQLFYYPVHDPASCFARLGLFGLSAGEEPEPSIVPQDSIYQAFGVGGRFTGFANDGRATQGAPVVVPHYSALIAPLHPEEAIKMWEWLIQNGHFSPLNNVESLMFPPGVGCTSDGMVWNQLKGSWNLVLQTLGWARYLTQQEKIGYVWDATFTNPLLKKGRSLLAAFNPSPILTPGGASTPAGWSLTWECEAYDQATVGQQIFRSNAIGAQVLGQFGAAGAPPWSAKQGFLVYANIDMPQIDQLVLKVRYSKYSPASVPIFIYVDDEPTPRGSFVLQDQGSWDRFAWSDPLALGAVASGRHSIKFFTQGQQYGVADLDEFVLAAGPPAVPAPTAVGPTAILTPTLASAQ